MAWFKVDDHLYSHPKWLTLPKGARALWVTAGSWSASQLLDGHIPAHSLPMLDGNRKEADALVKAGLWETNCDGWIFHDWADFQPTRSAVEDKRARDADRLRKWREERQVKRE